MQPSLHAQLLYDGYKTHPDLIQWWGSVPWQSVEDVLVWAETICRRPSVSSQYVEIRTSSERFMGMTLTAQDSLFYAIFTDQPGSDTPKTDPKDYVFAGVMGQISSSYADSTAEPGFIMILKAFQVGHSAYITGVEVHTQPDVQRTHVLTHAAGLMMHQILDLPAEGGLGLRRCQWHTTSLNVPSQKAALRLGYKYEGTIRAQKVLPPGKIGARGKAFICVLTTPPVMDVALDGG